MRFVCVLQLLATLSFAALPPLSEEARSELASDIVIGKVQSVIFHDVRDKNQFDYANRIFTASIRVTEVIKGSHQSIGSIISAHYWKAKDRPMGWTGDIGQNDSMHQGTMVKAYFTVDSANWSPVRNLLTPNGFDRH